MFDVDMIRTGSPNIHDMSLLDLYSRPRYEAQTWGLLFKKIVNIRKKYIYFHCNHGMAEVPF